MQSRWMSMVESVANVLVGYIVAVTTQYFVFPLFGLHATLSQNLMIGLIFTGVSLVRSYLLRRAFEARRFKANRMSQAKSSSSMAACTTNPVK